MAVTQQAPRSPQAASAERTLTITRDFNVPRTLAFEVWTSPQHLMRWWGPRDAQGLDFSTPSCDIDFRPGGKWRMCIQARDGMTLWQHGTYHEIVEPERLVFSFAWDNGGDAGVETLVTVTFEELAADKTRLTFTQTGFNSDPQRNGHVTGWAQCLDRLYAYLEARK